MQILKHKSISDLDFEKTLLPKEIELSTNNVGNKQTNKQIKI